jgi:serine phosphatase RsbU (regulator of sigma subunit)
VVNHYIYIRFKQHMVRKGHIFLYTVLLSLLFCAHAQSQKPDKTGDKAQTLARLKTAFIYNFTKYITWPKEDRLSEFRICVMSIEAKELSQQLNQLAKLRKFRDRIPIRIIYGKTSKDVKDCQMVVMSGFNKELVPVFNKIKGKGILMVAENLVDYKKSIISFVEADNRMNFIINTTKMAESGLKVNPELYKLAISKEEEWKNIFEKFKYMLQSGQQEITVNKSDLRQMMSQYKNLEEEQKSRDTLIRQLEDTIREKIKQFDEMNAEYGKIEKKITEGRQQLQQQEQQLNEQKNEIALQVDEIRRQRIVITIIAGLSMIIVILLVLAIRSTLLRRKSNRLLRDQKQELEMQKRIVDEKQKEILDSINYARRIQHALLPNEQLMKAHLPEHFVLFIAKDIVAGDFYWATPSPDGFLVITADCTGHGVPGAFMSLLNISKLNEAINQKRITRPDLVLNYVRAEIIQALNAEGSTEESKDGMDATLCKIDLKNMQLEFASANTSFCIVRNHELLSFKADKIPVGKSHDDLSLFTYNRVALQKGDMIFTYTDGYTSQFGGPKGKKFNQKQLREVLTTCSEMPIQQQKQVLEQRFEEWKGKLEQVDDVLVIGIRV